MFFKLKQKVCGEREQNVSCDDKAAYRRWSNLKVPVIARKVEACILRCMWLVCLNPKAELTNEKEKLPCK